MSRRVTLADRTRDVVALVLLLVGIAMYVRAYLGMHALREGTLAVPLGQFENIKAWGRFGTMSRYGLILAAGGLILAVGSHLWFLRGRGKAAP